MTSPDRPLHASAEIEVAATPEQVWRAIATGPGISAWFMPAEVEEREGGEIRMRHEPGADDRATVSVWQPPRRFAYEEDVALAPDQPPSRLAHEFLVESRAGGTCVVRVVSSGFGDGADWAELCDVMEQGWRRVLGILAVVLREHPDDPSASILAGGRTRGPRPAAWLRLVDALGLSAARPGDRVTISPPGGPALTGVVDSRSEHDLVVRVDGPCPGVALAYVFGDGEAGVNTGLRVFLFGPEAAGVAAREEPRWQRWFAQTFPGPRELVFAAEVPGTPDEVWETIATSRGVSAWFVPSEVEGRRDGRMVQHHGEGPDGIVTATVTAWDPPRRFAFAADDGWEPAPGAGAERIATELLVEGRDGRTSIVRLVASGFGTGSDWDDPVERVSYGWALCLAVLRLVRTSFAGRPSASAIRNGSVPAPLPEGWARYRAALGLEDAAVGDPVALADPPCVGEVAHAADRSLALIVRAPADALVVLTAADMGGRTLARLQLTAFGDDAETALARLEPAWSAWLESRLPMVPAGIRTG